MDVDWGYCWTFASGVFAGALGFSDGAVPVRLLAAALAAAAVLAMLVVWEFLRLGVKSWWMSR